MEVTGIILLAGSSVRMNGTINKAFLPLGLKKVINYSIDKFLTIPEIKKIILVYNAHDSEALDEILSQYDNESFIKVVGSTTRHLSLQNAMQYVDTPYMLVHDAARPYTNIDDIKESIEMLKTSDITTLYHKSVDAVKYNGKNLPRESVNLVTTPQGFNEKAIKYLKDHANALAADELEILENGNFTIGYVKESSPNDKITYKWDLEDIYKIGHSLDFHPFIPSDHLLLGGVKIPYEFGLKGYSDSDCVYHAVCESILGALNQGDLGMNYPDSDPLYKGISSTYFLNDAKVRLSEAGYEIVNLDIMIYLEEPKLKDYKKMMANNIALCLNISSDKVSVKATTFEKKGVIGTKEGVASESTVLIKKCYE